MKPMFKVSLIFVWTQSFLLVACSNQMKQPSPLLLFNQRTEETSKIYSMYPDGSQVTQIAELPTSSLYWLSPNGANLAFLSGSKLTLIDNLTGTVVAEIQDVGITVSEHFVDDIVWSPTGDRFIFASDSVGKQGTDLWLYDLTTGLKTPLTKDEAIDLEPAWSTNGQIIAFVSHKTCGMSAWDCLPEQEYWDITTIDVNSFTRQTITDLGSSGLLPSGNRWYTLLCNLSWSPDDKYIAFENACSSPDLQWWKQIFVVSIDGSNLFQLTHFSEYDPDTDQFPPSIFLYSKQWEPFDNRLLISYTEAELIENGERKNGFFIVSENEFFNPELKSKSNLLGSTSVWSPSKEYVIGNAISVLGFPLESPFIGKLNNNEIIALTSPESLPYGSCDDTAVYWSSDSQYVAYATNKHDNVCSHLPIGEQDIVIVSVSDTGIISHVVRLNGNNQPIGWLIVP